MAAAAEKNPFVDIKYPDSVGAPMKEEHFLRGTTPMHKAAALLKFDEVDKLLAAATEAGAASADVDTGDVLEQTPLLLLARNHYDPDDVPKAVEMINKLLAAGATTTVIDMGAPKIRRDQYGDSLLHLAAMASGKNGPTILKALCDALPADEKSRLVSARCKNFGNTAVRPTPASLSALSLSLRPLPLPHGRKPAHHPPPLPRQLHWATLGGDADACQILLDAGSRLDRKNRLKETIVDYAVKYEQVKLKVKYESLMGA